MTAKMIHRPAFHKSLSDPGFYPEANRQIKSAQSHSYWMYKTGPWVYKVMKPVAKMSPMLQEAYLAEVVAASNRLSPRLETRMEALVEEGGDWKLVRDAAPGAAPFYVLIQRQLAERGFLDQMLAKGKLTEKHAAQVAEELWRFHSEAEEINPKLLPGPEELLQRLQDLYYQSKKFLGQTLTKPMIDLSQRPLEVYLTDRKKLLARRVRKGFVRYYHGSLDLRRVHWSSEGVHFLAKSEDAVKDRYGDRISDLADLVVGLEHEGRADLAQALVDRYLSLSKDSEGAELLPLYRGMRCLKMGLDHSVEMGLEGADAEGHKKLAQTHFEQAVAIAAGLQP